MQDYEKIGYIATYARITRWVLALLDTHTLEEQLKIINGDEPQRGEFVASASEGLYTRIFESKLIDQEFPAEADVREKKCLDKSSSPG